jgi:hypothetical protein
MSTCIPAWKLNPIDRISWPSGIQDNFQSTTSVWCRGDTGTARGEQARSWDKASLGLDVGLLGQLSPWTSGRERGGSLTFSAGSEGKI